MAQAVPTDTPSTFIAKLLAPIAAPPASREVRSELRRDLADAWAIVQHRFFAAKALRDHRGHLSRAAEIERRTFKVPERQAEAIAQLALIEATDRLMHVPAPTIGALRHKQKWREIDGGRERWESEIAADELRLAGQTERNRGRK